MVFVENRQLSKANNFFISNYTIKFVLHKMLVFSCRIRIFYQNLMILKISMCEKTSVHKKDQKSKKKFFQKTTRILFLFLLEWYLSNIFFTIPSVD
jgi:hypothetical protein